MTKYLIGPTLILSPKYLWSFDI